MDRKLTFAFYGRDVSAGRTMSGLSGRTDTLRSRSLAAAKAVGVLAGGTALAALAKTLKTGFTELQDYEGGLSQLRAGLKSTHGASNTTAKGLENLASKIQAYSGQTDDSIVKTESLLLTFPAIRNEAGKTNKIFDQTVAIAADMAARMGTDASSAAVKLGKALNDPAKGLTALTRVGVVFTDQQAEQVKALVESGDTMAAQKIILRELNKEFGGSARLYGKTLPGQIERTKREFENVAQELATDLLPYALRFSKWVRRDALPALEDFGGWIKDHKTQLEWFGGIVGGLAVGFKAFKGVRSIQALVGKGPLAAGGVAGKAGVTPVYVTNWGGAPGTGVPGMPGGGKTSRLARIGSTLAKATIVVTAADIVAKSITGKSLTQIPGLIGGYNTAKDLRKYAPGGSLYEGGSARQQSALQKLFPQGMAAAAAGMKGDFAPAVQAIKDFKAAYDKAGLKDLNHLLGVHRRKAQDAAGGLKELAAAGDPLAGMYLEQRRAEDKAADGLRGLRAAMREAAAEAKGLGGDIIGGLIQGLHDRIPELEQEAKYVAATTIKHMRLAADARSPSRKTAQLGKDLAEGLWNGWLDYKPWDKLAASTRQGLRGLSNLAQAAVGYKAGIRQGVQTDVAQAVGSGVGTVTYLHAQRNDLRKFAHIYNQLRRKGLSESLLSQFAEAGPAALPAMESLLHGGIREANQTQRQIDRLGRRFATQATEDRYGKRIADSLDDLPREMARELVRELRRHGIHVAADSGQEAHRRRRAG